MLKKILDKILGKIRDWLDKAPPDVGTDVYMTIEDVEGELSEYIEDAEDEAEKEAKKKSVYYRSYLKADLDLLDAVLIVMGIVNIIRKVKKAIGVLALRRADYAQLLIELEAYIDAGQDIVPIAEKMMKSYEKWVALAGVRLGEKTDKRGQSFSAWIKNRTRIDYHEPVAILNELDKHPINELLRRVKKFDTSFADELFDDIADLKDGLQIFRDFFYGNTNKYPSNVLKLIDSGLSGLEDTLPKLEEYVESLDDLDPKNVLKDLKKAEKEAK